MWVSHEAKFGNKVASRLSVVALVRTKGSLFEFGRDEVSDLGLANFVVFTLGVGESYEELIELLHHSSKHKYHPCIGEERIGFGPLCVCVCVCFVKQVWF